MLSKKCIAWLFCLSTLAGCSQFLEHQLEYPPAAPPDAPPPPKTQGRIYQPGYEIRLYSDNVACRVGDILTIRLEESTKGEYRAATKTDKKASLTYPIPTFFGQTLPGLEVETNTQQKFDGKGDSDQSNKLMGTISVTVTSILPNGNLVIKGESWVTINQGREYVQLSGIVRQVDISPNNVVSSQRVASANITYGSAGQAGYASHGGFLTRFFNRFAPY